MKGHRPKMRGNCPEIKGQNQVCGVSEFRVCQLTVEKTTIFTGDLDKQHKKQTGGTRKAPADDERNKRQVQLQAVVKIL